MVHLRLSQALVSIQAKSYQTGQSLGVEEALSGTFLKPPSQDLVEFDSTIRTCSVRARDGDTTMAPSDVFQQGQR
jgi:hypothetical protein